MAKIHTRMGDGVLVEMEPDQLKRDIEAGSRDAADRGKIDPLSEGELEHLYDICTMPYKVVSVERGNELILTIDGGTNKIFRLGVPTGRVTRIQIHERAFGADTMELAHLDYSFKQVKAITHEEKGEMEQALLTTTLPLFYGAMPNLGLYSQPDGPVPNPSELMPKGLIKEAQQAQEEAIEHAVKDMVFVASSLYEAGADGINFDTTGAAGDADVKATLLAIEILKEKYPEMGVEMGMAGEFILGMHGSLEHHDTRLAGLYPHKQVKLAEKSGVSIFGAVVNTNSSKSFPWNLARAVTYCKACVENAEIPVHANVGMGVGGVPNSDINPVDAISRTSKAMAEIGKLDGLQIGMGEAFGMVVTHAMAAGMGGIRTAGDLVARMQIARGMKINEAKKYVADKMGCSLLDLSDEVAMYDLREMHNIGRVTTAPGLAKGLEAKVRIGKLLGLEINSVNTFKRNAGVEF